MLLLYCFSLHLVEELGQNENKACIIEVRTHDINDRINSLQIRHRITIPSGTPPEQLDKITTAAVAQVSRELSREAAAKIPHHGMCCGVRHLI